MGMINRQFEYPFYVMPNGDYNEIASRKIGLPALQVDLNEFLDLSFGIKNKEKLCIFIKRSDERVANVFYPVDERTKINNYVQMTRGTNQYVSVSTYFKNKKTHKKEKLRTQSNIVHTHLLYQDLDFYKLGLSISEVLAKLFQMIVSGELLCPSFYVFTGRGIQLCWRMYKFKNIENFVNDRDFQLIQEHLFNLLKPFNSDNVSKNPSAVMRLTDSWHVGARKDVRTYFTNETMFTLKDMIFHYGLVPNADRKVKPKPVKNTTPQNKIVRNTKSWNEFTLNRQREEDIFIYVREMNKRGNGYPVKRNWLALVLRFHALVSEDGDRKYAQKRVEELCEIMDLADSSVSEILRRSKPAEKFYDEWVTSSWDKKKYVQGGLFYTNKRLLELMEVETDYELQWKMKTIKIKNKKYDTMRKHFEALRDGKIKGNMHQYNERRLSEKEQKIEELRKLLIANPKIKQREIAEKLGVSRVRITQLMKEIKKGK